MKPAMFAYHRPMSVAEATGLLASHGESAKVLAGGQSLMPMMALRLTSFEHLVDIGRIESLSGIDRVADRVVVGAGTTQAAIEQSEVVARHVPLLSRATPLIGHFQIRNRGTIGGSLAHADAAAEYPAVVLSLDAELEIAGPGGTRNVPASEFFTGRWTTVLEDTEVLTAVSFPVRSGRSGSAIREFARRRGDFAVAGAAVSLELDDEDRVVSCGLATFGLGSMAMHSSATAASVLGVGLAELRAADVAHAAVAEIEMVVSDLHGSAGYRRRVGAAVAAEAWSAAVEEATR